MNWFQSRRMLLCDCGSTIVTATCIYVTTRSKWNTLELYQRNHWTTSVPLEQPLQRPGVRADSATISGGHHVTHASPFIARAAIIQGRKGAPSPGAHRESSTASRVVYPPVAAIQRREREEGSETAGAKVRRFVSFLYFRCVRFANLVVGIKCDGFQR